MKYSTFYAKLTPNGAVSGTVFSISVTGITAVTDGQKTYGTTPLYFAITPKSSGMATVTFKNDTTGDIIGTKTIMVRSNTLANPTYDLNVSATSVNEGGTITFTVDTSDVSVNTNIPYTITGVSLSDIDLPSLTGNFKVTSNGTASLPIKIIEDNTLEGLETLTLTLDGKGLSKSVTINDTSNIQYTGTIFEVGSWNGSTHTQYGYSQKSNYNFGRELSDELSYKGILVDLDAVVYEDVSNGSVTMGSMVIVLANKGIVSNSTKFHFTLTNLTTNISITTPNFLYDDINSPGFNYAVLANDVVNANKMFVVGQNISVELIEAHSGYGTFTVGQYTQAAGVYNTGYMDYPAGTQAPKFGIELNDDLKINNSLINLTSCYILNVPASNVVSLWVSIANTGVITDTMGISIKLTNMSNNATYTSPVLDRIYVSTDPWVGGMAVQVNDASEVAALRSIMTSGTNVKAEISYTDTNTITLDVIGTFVKTETYNSKSYDIGWGVNAYDYFVSKIGRAPLVGENISFKVGPNTALVATSTSVGALHFDTRFNNVGSLTVSNSGIVLGRGGTGTDVGSNNTGNPGGTAIVNLSTKPVTVYNTNLVAGGGNGGSGASGSWNNRTGGYGAPWGANTTLSFTTPESGSHAGGGVYSSSGHNWGDTGKIITGVGSVINQGDGISLGY